MTWLEWFEMVGPILKDFAPLFSFAGVCVVALASWLIAKNIEGTKFKFKRQEISVKSYVEAQILIFDELITTTNSIISLVADPGRDAIETITINKLTTKLIDLNNSKMLYIPGNLKDEIDQFIHSCVEITLKFKPVPINKIDYDQNLKDVTALHDILRAIKAEMMKILQVK